MKLARPEVGSTSETPRSNASSSEGSNPSPSTNSVTSSETRPMFCEQVWQEDPLVTPNHLWVLEGQFIVRGMVITGREAMDLPWRRKKDNEPASQAEIGRELELVKALAIRGKVQTPKDFESTLLYIREDIK